MVCFCASVFWTFRFLCDIIDKLFSFAIAFSKDNQKFLVFPVVSLWLGQIWITYVYNFVACSCKFQTHHYLFPCRKCKLWKCHVSDPSAQKVPSPEDQEYIQRAHACIKECHLEHLINESKFLRLDSLQELVKVCCLVCIYSLNVNPFSIKILSTENFRVGKNYF